eukprot:scaffold1717_cov117-Cylindrotheca_fusiformis.AAC.11
MAMNSSLTGNATYQKSGHQEQRKYPSGTSIHSESTQRSHSGSHGHQSQAQDYMSVGSHYSRSSFESSHNSSHVDEAYRRLGQRLSIRAHGDRTTYFPPAVSTIGMSQKSMFLPYDQLAFGQQYDLYGMAASPGSRNRTATVSKTMHSDGGDHHRVLFRDCNILRKMTINATELFRLIQAGVDSVSVTPGGDKKRRTPEHILPQVNPQQSGGDLSQQRFAFTQLALDGSVRRSKDGTQQPPNSVGQSKHGVLAAVIESTSQTSRGGESNSKASRTSSLDSSIATRTSLDTKLSSTHRILPAGKCLTQPSTPETNDGFDNADGNLIVHENDVIRISRKQIHVLNKDSMRDVTLADFRIQCILGQGTFAQVFQCLHLQTGKLVAIKIVKNKPAYTRQAAVEIDVFRALSQNQEKRTKSLASQDHRFMSSNTSPIGAISSEGPKSDYMVDLVCYFMYKSHLCLVFELLGLNLYEVLKRRQFRGLPLSVVRTLLKQAVLAIAELAKKSIVHCDIKPENILLATDDDVSSVVGARWSSTLSSSLESKQEYPPTTASELTKAINGEGAPRKRNEGVNTDLRKALNESKGHKFEGHPVEDFSRSPGSSLGTVGSRRLNDQRIKLIDFGSACFEGQTSHTYIQSRFYRSPEVLIGLPYDSGIDMWSLGCVAAELFLGLPILPGVHEHDQLGRISEMISVLPSWMLDRGSKSSRYYVTDAQASDDFQSGTPGCRDHSLGQGSKSSALWRLRSQEEYIASLSANEIEKKGGLAKLEKQPANRYFKKRKLADIISHKGRSGQPEDSHLLDLFIHFLYGILNPDPWKRWTAHQAAQHPFFTGISSGQRIQESLFGNTKNENRAVVEELHWEPPLDPGICRRRLLTVQKVREMHQAARRVGYSNSGNRGSRGHRRRHSNGSNDGASFSRNDEGLLGSLQRQARGSGLFDRAPFPPQVPLQHECTGNMRYPDPESGSSQLALNTKKTNSISGSTTNSLQGTVASQSFSDGVYSGIMQGSYSDLGFAYSLHRPGVVPMGGSISSSLDTSITLPQQYQQDEYHHQQQQQHVSDVGNTLNHWVRHRTSDMSGSTTGCSVDNSVGGAASSTNTKTEPSYPSDGVRQLDLARSAKGYYDGIMQHPGGSFKMITSQMAPNNAGHTDVMWYGNAQAYLQQQHEALQQQQALLQQQQAALALQQQQLQAYGVNPTVFPGSQSSLSGPRVDNRNRFGHNGGDYYNVGPREGNMSSNSFDPQRVATRTSTIPRQHENFIANGDSRLVNNSVFSHPRRNPYGSGMSM